MSHILSYPANHLSDESLSSVDVLLEELADEARSYLKLLERLKAKPSDYERERLEGDLYTSIAHFKIHSEMTLDYLDELSYRLPE